MPHDTGQRTAIEIAQAPVCSEADCLITSQLPPQFLLHDLEEALAASDELILTMSRLGMFVMIPFAVSLQDALRVAHLKLSARTPGANSADEQSQEKPISESPLSVS